MICRMWRHIPGFLVLFIDIDKSDVAFMTQGRGAGGR
jgi:hypothetical protein